MKLKNSIPVYDLQKFRHVHREQTDSVFGYDNLEVEYRIPGFELYSSKGLVSSVGPLKSDFYRMSITCSGTLDMQIGLEHYQHQAGTVSFTYPGQLFAKDNISEDVFGYYMLFSREFLERLVPTAELGAEFPFYSQSGLPVFRLNEMELNHVVELLLKINVELRQKKLGKQKAVQMYLYLILLESKRSYERQQLQLNSFQTETHKLVSRFIRLVSVHYLSLRLVTDYAEMLSVSPDYLNRTVRNHTGRTASETIKAMLLLEAKSLLKYTQKTVAEVGYDLGFSDPTSFNRFFRTETGETPLSFRNRTD